jgi:protein CpxP
MKRTLLATIAALACFALANQVLAQSDPAAAPRDQQRDARVQRMCESIDARLDGRLTYMQTRLKITDQQKPAWDSYAKAMRTSLDPLRQDCASGAVGRRGTTLPERLDAMQHLAEQRVASLRTLKPAADGLYAALTPDQQKLADRVLLSPGPRGPGGPRRG